MREAGYNIHAQNPHSSAYGMAQFINGPSEYYQYGGNPNTAAGQAVAMLNYIAQRYGDPIAAWNHELSAGFYDQGGTLPPGWTMAYNGTGQNEHILTGGQMSNLIDSLNTLSDHIDKLTTGQGGPGALSASGYTPGSYVGDYTGVVSPAGGGFGLTDANLGIAPSNST